MKNPRPHIPDIYEWKKVLSSIPIKETPMNKKETAIEINKNTNDPIFEDWLING